MNTDTNTTIFKLDVFVYEDEEVTSRNDYTMKINVDIIKDDKDEVLIEAEYKPLKDELVDYYNDEDFVSWYMENLELEGIISTEEMTMVVKTVMDEILSKVPAVLDFEYEAVPASYAPYSRHDSPPEVMMPICVNNAAIGDYKLNVVRENGEIKIIKE